MIDTRMSPRQDASKSMSTMVSRGRASNRAEEITQKKTMPVTMSNYPPYNRYQEQMGYMESSPMIRPRVPDTSSSQRANQYPQPVFYMLIIARSSNVLFPSAIRTIFEASNSTKVSYLKSNYGVYSFYKCC